MIRTVHIEPHLYSAAIVHRSCLCPANSPIPLGNVSFQWYQREKDKLREKDEHWQEHNFKNNHRASSLPPLNPENRMWVTDQNTEAEVVEQISPRVRAPTGGIEEHFCHLPYQDRSSYSDIDPELAITNAPQDQSLPLPQADQCNRIIVRLLNQASRFVVLSDITARQITLN